MTEQEHESARRLAERGLQEQRAGALVQAERSLEDALKIDPDAVAEVLHQTGADTAPDSRDAAADRDAGGPDRSRVSGSGAA